MLITLEDFQTKRMARINSINIQTIKWMEDSKRQVLQSMISTDSLTRESTVEAKAEVVEWHCKPTTVEDIHLTTMTISN